MFRIFSLNKKRHSQTGSISKIQIFDWERKRKIDFPFTRKLSNVLCIVLLEDKIPLCSLWQNKKRCCLSRANIDNLVNFRI